MAPPAPDAGPLYSASVGKLLETLKPWLLPGGCVVLAGGLGVFLEIALHWLVRHRTKAGDPRMPTFLRAFRGALFLLSIAAGLHIGSFMLPQDVWGKHAEIVRLLRQGLLVVAVLAVSLVVSRMACSLIRLWAAQASASLPSTPHFEHLTQAVVFLLGLLILLQTLGIAITPLITAMGIGGLSIGLALQGTLANLFSGLQILLSKQIRPGDFVRLESGEEGYIADITLRNTTLKTLSDNLVIIPNGKLVNAVVMNYFRPQPEMDISVPIGVAYASDLDKVEQVTIEVAREVLRTVPEGVTDFEPVVRFTALGDSAIQFNTILRARKFSDQYRIKHEFIKRLVARYRKEGIEIPFPTRTIRTEKADGA